MTITDPMVWPALFGLGAVHGVNPGMGWLFAVALGLQHGGRRAVLGALVPLAAGHAAAIGAAMAAAVAIGFVVPAELLRLGVAALLVGVGLRRLARARHPRYGGMQVSPRELAVWSFLMASTHGAGLMVLPLVLGRPGSGTAVPAADAGVRHLLPHHAALAPATTSGDWSIVLAAAVHSIGYLATTAVLAVLVYERFGLRLLRTAWINLDLLWSVALVLAGVGTLIA